MALSKILKKIKACILGDAKIFETAETPLNPNHIDPLTLCSNICSIHSSIQKTLVIVLVIVI